MLFISYMVDWKVRKVFYIIDAVGMIYFLLPVSVYIEFAVVVFDF